MQIPFYINHGHRCAQTSMKSALKVILPNRDFSYEELDRLTIHSRDNLVYPSQIAAGLANIGVDFEYYVKTNWTDKASHGRIIHSIKEYYGIHADKILSKTNLESLEESVSFLSNDKRVKEIEVKPSLNELESKLGRGKISICLVNYDILVSRENKFSGHYTIITGFDKNEVIYHDSGPKGACPNKKISKEIFEKAWNLCFFDHDLIIV